MKARYEALSRTARLVNQVFFDGLADERRIIDGLQTTRVRLVADATNLESRAAQAGVVTSFQLIARTGIGVELDLADVPLVGVVPPLRRERVSEALLDLGADPHPGLGSHN